MKNINIVIGITGGIAAYKACGIVSYLKNEGANVDEILNNGVNHIKNNEDVKKLLKNK